MPNTGSAYEIRQPGRLVVAYLQPNEHFDESLSESTVISVVRNIHEVAIDSDLYKPVLALTKERDVLFHMVDGGFEITTYADGSAPTRSA